MGWESSTWRFSLTPRSPARSTRRRRPPFHRAAVEGPLSPELLDRMQRYWQAANYLTVGQIYLQANPLLREPLRPEHIKPRLLGHWGTSPGLSFIYVHLNRLITEHDADVIYLAGPGHGGPALVANVYLEGTYSEIYPARHAGRGRACARCSASSRRRAASRATSASPTPGSIHEGGELGYVLIARLRRGLRQPGSDRRRGGRRRRGGDRPAGGLVEGHQLPQPGARRRGAADPAPQRLQDRRPDGAGPRQRRRRARRCSRATATRCTSSRATTRRACTRTFAATLDTCYAHDPRHPARGAHATASRDGRAGRRSCCARPRAGPGPRWWTACRSRARSARTRCRWPRCARTRSTSQMLEEWMRSYKPEELFDATARLVPELAALAPTGDRRMGANPHANGGKLLVDLDLPDFRDYAIDGARSPAHGAARVDAPARPDAARHLHAQRQRRRTSGSSAPTRPTRTASAPSSRSRTAASSGRRSPSTTTSRPTAG